MADLGKIPPHQIEAEQSLLGGLLIDSEGIPAALELIRGEEFYRESHRVIFGAIVELFERGQPVDLVSVHSLLEDQGKLEAVGGSTYLAGLVDIVPSAANVEAYARIVSEKAVLRRIIQGANEVTSLAYAGGKSLEEITDCVESTMLSATEGRKTTRYVSMRDLMKGIAEEVDRLTEFSGSVSGVPSGYPDLDRMTCGFQPSDLIILAARPSVGKTALALCLARNAAELGQLVGVFSLEMSKEQLRMRLLCSEARVDSQKVRAGFISKNEGAQLLHAAGNLADVPILIDDTPHLSVLELRAKARRMMAEAGLSMVIVDYLQLMRGRSATGSREQEISEISRSLKGLAKELNIPVIALSQLNRKLEERQDKRPQLSDLRESGALEQDSDVILFLYRDEVYNKATAEKGVAEVIIGKQRSGPKGTVKLAYIDTYTRFESLAYGANP